MAEDKKEKVEETAESAAAKETPKAKKSAAKKAEKPAETPEAKTEATEAPVAEEKAPEPKAEAKEVAPAEEKKEEKVEEPAAEEAAPVAEKKAADKPKRPRKKAAVEVQAEAETEEPVAEVAEATEEEDKPKHDFTAKDPDPVRPTDFDWDSMDKRKEKYPEAEQAQMETMYNETITPIEEHDVLDGTVVRATKKELVVNIGYKSEGVISRSETRYNPDLTEGDTIEVYVDKKEDKGGQLVLSHRKARALRSWERINKAMEDDEVITGQIKCRTKGGLIADIFGIEAFLPGSQIDVKPIRDYDIYVGKTMEFKVVKINHEFKNVVVSHKALIQAELEQQKKEIIGKLEKGQVLEGVVKNITSYGVFIDLGGVDGLVHITDLSWGRVSHPEEVVTLDEKINVVILDFDDDKKRIALGIKQLSAHPWEALDANLQVGDKIKGKVVVMADYGAFIEVAAGVEGLIHVSEMSWSQHLRSAQDFLKVGDEVDAVILTLDREERKMSLGMKQLVPDPWADITTKYPVESQHTAKVKSFTNFGIFVELEEGVDGLVHISDLSWNKKIKHPAEFTSLEADLEVKVLEIDVENRRLSLGHKQLEENPWDVFETVFAEGTEHEATVTQMNDKGGVVMLPYGVEGFCPKRHLAKEDGSKGHIDETLKFQVIEFNKESRKIIVSHAHTYQDEASMEKAAPSKKAQRAGTAKAIKKVSDNLEKTTLGDLDALSNLKASMQESEKKAKKD
jgi:small subunit ribosomal protein S1